jgi:hypothetical protein
MPSQYIRIAEPAGLMSLVDNVLLFRCIQVVRRWALRNKEIGVFCNLSRESRRFLGLVHRSNRVGRQVGSSALAFVFDRRLGTHRKLGGRRSEMLVALAQTLQFALGTFLDVDQQLRCFSLLQDEAERGTAFVAVTHDLERWLMTADLEKEGADSAKAPEPKPAATHVLKRGSVKRKALPPPSGASTQIRPPCASTMPRQIASPRPTLI